MKTTTLIKALFVCILAVFIISCRTSRTTRRPVPSRHPAPSHRTVGNLPPGHAKKVYGYQSAKPFAPGQQKKNVGTKGNSKKVHHHKSKGRK